MKKLLLYLLAAFVTFCVVSFSIAFIRGSAPSTQVISAPDTQTISAPDTQVVSAPAVEPTEQSDFVPVKIYRGVNVYLQRSAFMPREYAGSIVVVDSNIANGKCMVLFRDEKGKHHHLPCWVFDDSASGDWRWSADREQQEKVIRDFYASER